MEERVLEAGIDMVGGQEGNGRQAGMVGSKFGLSEIFSIPPKKASPKVKCDWCGRLFSSKAIRNHVC